MFEEAFALSGAENIDGLLEHLKGFLESKSLAGDIYTLGAENEAELDHL